MNFVHVSMVDMKLNEFEMNEEFAGGMLNDRPATLH